MSIERTADTKKWLNDTLIRNAPLIEDTKREVLSPQTIISSALTHNPKKIFVGFSGGRDSMATAKWMSDHVEGVEMFHANTGIGIERTREFVRDTCRDQGWKLTEIKAKEDCGQDYDVLVKKYGFPGPQGHQFMYRRLKERCVEKLVRDNKTKRSDKIMIATGIRHDESRVRAGYAGREINFKGSQMWVNPLYWWTKSDMAKYIDPFNLPRNPVSDILGMSGECLCGAFAHSGEMSLVRLVCPKTADRLLALQIEVKAAGHEWGWEDKPPSEIQKYISKHQHVMEFCHGCEKQEMAHDAPHPTLPTEIAGGE